MLPAAAHKIKMIYIYFLTTRNCRDKNLKNGSIFFFVFFFFFCTSSMVYVLSKQINKQLDSSPSRDVHINANTDQRLTLYFYTWRRDRRRKESELWQPGKQA